MQITEISKRELLEMENEGIVFQGCGGPLEEWVEGINKMLTNAEILLEGSRFEHCFTFKNDEFTCLLFPLKNQKIDFEKMMIWRLVTSAHMSCMWLSDFEDIYLRDAKVKPDCKLIGENGNIFNLIGIASKTLKENGLEEAAQEMTSRIQQSGSYEEALGIIGEYVNITAGDDEIEEEEEGVIMQQ